MGVLQGIEATVSVDLKVIAKFHHHCPVLFVVNLRRKCMEKTVKAQVTKGELIPVEASE